MPRRSLLAVLAAALLAPAATHASTPSGPVADQCAPAGQQVQTIVCYGADVLTRDAEAYAQPGRFEDAIRTYETSWTHRALGLQYQLAGDLPLGNAPWLGTHNSFNSIAEEGPSLSDTDSNQQLVLTDQLRLDMRSLELDVHWFPSWRANGENATVVCHAGAVSDHDGCTTERLLPDVLDEIAGWLRAHPDQVLLLYVEAHLDGGGHDPAAAALKSKLGSMIYPTGSSTECVELPAKTLTRDDVLAAGAQVVIVTGSCGTAGAWRAQTFAWNEHREDQPNDYARSKSGCGPYSSDDYDTRLIRFYEDSTWLTAGSEAFGDQSDRITKQTAALMVRCGVDLFGFDQLVPGDGRLDALVWSWAEGQPSASGDCAATDEGGRWVAASCKRRKRVACRADDGNWFVPAKPKVPQKGATAVCEDRGATFSVPRTGKENVALANAADGASVWLADVRRGATWHTLDSRS
jgi:hypothetical protein